MRSRLAREGSIYGAGVNVGCRHDRGITRYQRRQVARDQVLLLRAQRLARRGHDVAARAVGAQIRSLAEVQLEEAVAGQGGRCRLQKGLQLWPSPERDGSREMLVWRHHWGMYTIEDMPTGWVKPAAKPTPETLKARIAELRAELAEAENQLREMEEGTRLEALVKVRNLMRAFELTPVDLGLTPTPKRRGRPRKAAA
jgi:hypothetical protein